MFAPPLCTCTRAAPIRCEVRQKTSQKSLFVGMQATQPGAIQQNRQVGSLPTNVQFKIDDPSDVQPSVSCKQHWFPSVYFHRLVVCSASHTSCA